MLFYDTIVAHAEASPEEEVCGVIGTTKDAHNQLIAIPCANTHPNRREHFRIELEELRKAEERVDLIAVYHSHVNGLMEASTHDKAVADEIMLPAFIYVPAKKDAVCYVPDTYQPPLEGRKFLPLIHDCCTYVRDYYRAKLGVVLTWPARTYLTWQRLADKLPAWISENGFEVFLEPKQHDILVFSINHAGVPNHAAVYEGDGVMGHQRADHPSNLNTFGGFWEKSVNLVLRHKSLAH